MREPFSRTTAWVRASPLSLARALTDSGLLADGLNLVKLKSGADGKASVKVKGLGSLLGMVSLPLSMEPALTVQLINDEGVCWSNTFSGAKKNTNRQFKAKSSN